jgi:hypothetical protein
MVSVHMRLVLLMLLLLMLVLRMLMQRVLLLPIMLLFILSMRPRRSRTLVCIVSVLDVGSLSGGRHVLVYVAFCSRRGSSWYHGIVPDMAIVRSIVFWIVRSARW